MNDLNSSILLLLDNIFYLLIDKRLLIINIST